MKIEGACHLVIYVCPFNTSLQCKNDGFCSLICLSAMVTKLFEKRDFDEKTPPRAVIRVVLLRQILVIVEGADERAISPSQQIPKVDSPADLQIVRMNCNSEILSKVSVIELMLIIHIFSFSSNKDRATTVYWQLSVRPLILLCIAIRQYLAACPWQQQSGSEVRSATSQAFIFKESESYHSPQCSP